MVTTIEPTLISKDIRPVKHGHHSSDSVPPYRVLRFSTATPQREPPPQAPLHPTFDLRGTSTPETELFIAPKPKKPSYNPQPRPRDLEAANVLAPAYSEQYAPPPSTAYYPPLSSRDVYNPDNGTRRSPYTAPKREGDRPWVWELASCDGYRNTGCFLTLCGFRTRDMPPGQIMCLLIPTVGLMVAMIVVVVVLTNRRS